MELLQRMMNGLPKAGEASTIKRALPIYDGKLGKNWTENQT